MNNMPHKWEADIRSTVEDHVFEYDPSAWVEMEKLLGPVTSTGGEAASDTSKPTGAGWSISGGSLWIGFCILIGFAGLAWSLRQQNAPAYTSLHSWPITVEVPSPVQTTISPATPQLDLDVNPLQPTATKVTPILPLPKSEIAFPKSINAQNLTDFMKRSITKTTPSLPTLALPPYLKSEAVYPELTTVKTVPTPSSYTPIKQKTKRRPKRDRKTLFPDVINQY